MTRMLNNHYYQPLGTFSRSKKEHIKLTLKDIQFFLSVWYLLIKLLGGIYVTV